MAEQNKTYHSFSDEDLLNYINSNVSAREANLIEKEIRNDPFLSDAVEGLRHFSSTSKVRKDVHDINVNLKQQTTKRKGKKIKKVLELNSILYLLFFILIILLIAFVVLHGIK